MNKIKLLFAGIGVSGVLLFVSATGFGQIAVEPSYEVTVHILMGSPTDSAKNNLPGNLDNVVKQLKSRVGYSNFRQGGIILGRMSNRSDWEYKSFSDLFGSEIDPKLRTFVEMTIGGLKNGAIEKGPAGFQIDAFRFGARVPIVTSSGKDESGKDRSVVNYEQIGLTLRKLNLGENLPTLVGTLDLPGANNMIFLILTVKSTDL